MKRAFPILIPLLLHLSLHAAAKPNPREGYLGDDACKSCHAAQVDTYHQTSHYQTSALPNQHTILGNFTPGNNLLKTANPNLSFRMDSHDGGFFQTAQAPTSSRTEQFALVIGSGEKGQTYLFRDEDQLFQLPISYWTDLGWVNSPGYRDGFADFERAIIPRCLECHATYIESLAPPSNRYNPASIALGIQCEKCHGPGRKHVSREASPSGSAILNPAHFTRDRQMDLCAWCHGGHGQPQQPSFSYLPGSPLEKFIALPKPDPSAPLDVHGNQVELLKQSRCYLASSMTCLTCHNVHVAQHDLSGFSQRCLTCHQPTSATFAKPNHPVTNNCIDCHMPRQETNLIVFDFAGKRVRPQVRNHWIKVYSAPGPVFNKDTPTIP